MKQNKARNASKVAKKYQHLKVNQPVRLKEGPKKFIVRARDKGKEKIVRFGSREMEHYKNPGGKPGGHGDEKRRANFKARHNCKAKTNKLTPGWWSCNSTW